MTTLVTGGTGFVGSNVVKRLAQLGHDVVCFDLNPPDNLFHHFIEPWASRVTFLQGDILDNDDLERLSGLDITRVVHAAVFTGVLPRIDSLRSRSIVDINVMGTTNMLEVARRLSVERFLYVSSVAVYGQYPNPEDVLFEDGPLYPRTLYAVTKYASELLARRYGELHGFHAVCTRLGGPYGPMERVTSHRANQSLIKEWTGKASRNESIEVSDLTRRGEFTYVADIAAGICAVLDAPAPTHDVYNVSCGAWNTLEEVLGALRELYPDLQVIKPHTGEADLGGPRGPLPARGNRIDITRIQEDFGYTPEFDLASGLKEYVA